MTNLTKDLIKKTFASVLELKPLTQITVKMLVEECGINRNSFYYHYHDLPALVEEIIKEQADKIMKEYPTIESAEMALCAAADFASQNKRAFLHIYNSVNRDIFERYLWKVCEYIIESYGNDLLNGINVHEFDRKLISTVCQSECFGIVISWLDQRMEPDLKKQISRFCELFHGIIEEVIKRSAES